MRARLLPLIAVLATILTACSAAPAYTPPGQEAPATASAAAPAPASPPVAIQPPPARTGAVFLRDPAETQQARQALAAEPDPAPRTTDLARADLARADYVLADAAVAGAVALLTETWAAVAPQRQDVLEVSLADLRSLLAGTITDWAAVGGAVQPVTLILPAAARRVLAAVGVSPDATGTATVEETLAMVASTPGALGLAPIAALRPGVLALVVAGHDPYRDAADLAPLAVRRWLRAPDAATALRLQAALGWTPAAPLNPAGVLATGDTIPARCVNTVLEARGDAGAMFDGVRARLAAADLTVLSMEIALTDRSAPTPCVATFFLQGRPAAAAAFAAAGVDVVTTAGNHAMDCWEGCPHPDALADTMAALEAAGLAHTGGGASLAAARTPALVARDGVRIAVLAYDDIAPYYAATAAFPGIAPLDLVTLAGDVRAAKAQADHVLVAFSWGVEYTADPTARQQEAARIAVEAGASVIIGNHPHWVQAVQGIGGAVVTYALGNLVFDQDWSVETMQGMVLEVGLTRDRVLGFRLRPTVIRDLHRPEFVDPAGEGAPILARVWAASDRLPAIGPAE